jgi:hypothetical protein
MTGVVLRSGGVKEVSQSHVSGILAYESSKVSNSMVAAHVLKHRCAGTIKICVYYMLVSNWLFRAFGAHCFVLVHVPCSKTLLYHMISQSFAISANMMSSPRWFAKFIYRLSFERWAHNASQPQRKGKVNTAAVSKQHTVGHL